MLHTPGCVQDSQTGTPGWLEIDDEPFSDEESEEPSDEKAEEPGMMKTLDISVEPRKSPITRRYIRIKNHAKVDAYLQGILIPEDDKTVLKEIRALLTLKPPAAEVEVVLERLTAKCPKYLQKNTVRVGQKARIPVGKGAKGMQVWVYNKQNLSQEFGSAYLDVGSKVIVSGDPDN